MTPMTKGPAPTTREELIGGIGTADEKSTGRELLRGGQAWSRRLRRNQQLRLTDVDGRACVSALFYNARDPLERYNMPDTLKAQFTAFLTAGRVLYSDMGRVLCSIIADDCGWHDTITGLGDAAANQARFGDGTYQSLRNAFHRNAPRQPAGRAGQARPRQAGRRRQRELLHARDRRRRRRARVRPRQQPPRRGGHVAVRDGHAGRPVVDAPPAGSRRASTVRAP